MSAPQTASPDRRRNNSLRNQAQAWFEALQREINQMEGAETVAALFKDWKKPEDIMRSYPALVPLFLDMVWRARKTPAFADLMRNEAGDVVDATTEVLALSRKNFDEMIISHLMGAMRLTCERRQNEWIAIERERRRSAISKLPVIGSVLRSLGLSQPPQTEVLLADYPQKGVYEALKPSLVRREQFTLVDALATLPTRTVTLLGPVTSTLNSPAVIRTLVGLDKSALKVAIEIAEAYVQATSIHSSQSQDLTQARGAALSDMLLPGTHFVRLAANHRQLAVDAITKFAPVMKTDIWALFGNREAVESAESLRRVTECPPGIAANLLELTIQMNERVSLTLAELTDVRVATFAMEVLRNATDPETFLTWIREETYLSVWKQLVFNLNRDAGARPSEGALGTHHQTAIKNICASSVQSFAAESPVKQAA